jgi:hypothetical protein
MLASVGYVVEEEVKERLTCVEFGGSEPVIVNVITQPQEFRPRRPFFLVIQFHKDTYSE